MKNELLISLEGFEESEKYWLEKLSGEISYAGLPVDFHNGGEYKKAGYKIEFGENLREKISQISKDNNLSIYIILLTVFKILLNKYTGEDDITVASPIYNQGNSEYNNVVLLKESIQPGLTFKELLMSVKRTVVQGYENEHYPVEKLVEYLELDESLMYRNIFLYDAIHRKELIDEIINDSSNQITVCLSKNDQVLEGEIIYNHRLFKKETIETVSRRYLYALTQVLNKTDLQVNRIQWMTEEEKNRVLFQFNNNETAEPPDKTIHQLFERQVERTPGNIALHSSIAPDNLFEGGNPWKKIEHCCFRKNPYIYRCDLELYGKKSGFKILKTHKHNTVVVNDNVSAIIDAFDGKTNAASLFSALKDKPLRLLIHTVKPDDILEIVITFTGLEEIRLSGESSQFTRFLKILYTNNLIDPAGFSSNKSPLNSLVETLGEPAESFDLPDLSNDILMQNKDLSKARVLLLGDTPGMPTTGLLYMASYLRRSGIEALCRFNDTNPGDLQLKAEIEGLLYTIQPEVVAVSMKWFPYIQRVFDICRIVKEYSPDVRVVVGGNTASYYGEEVIRNQYVDYVIRGDGELPLLEICRGTRPENIPNCIYKSKNGEYAVNPITYVQNSSNSSDIYLSHLEEILISTCSPIFGSFFVFTHKGCGMNCIYCGGCRDAQKKAFNRANLFVRSVEEVRKDILEAMKYTSTFVFDFDGPNQNILEYCEKIWDGIDLSNHFCVYLNIYTPSAALIELVNRTFKYTYCELDLTSLSEAHRQRLVSERLVKPQPTDAEILAFLDECEKYDNNEVRIDLINGLPYFTEEDIGAGDRMFSTITRSYSCFSNLHWARLHAQPGAPIISNAETYDMYSLATNYEDFLKSSQTTVKKDRTFSNMEYPYIYYKDEGLNSKISKYYAETGLKLSDHRNVKKQEALIHTNMTYRDLNNRANQLARLLRTKGVHRNSVVGVMMDGSPDLAVAILAILKAGGAYLPLAPFYPEKAAAHIFKDSNMQFLVTGHPVPENVPPSLSTSSLNIISIDNEKTGEYAAGNLETGGRPSDLAYIIYTSGSTGKPKGILAEHRGIVNYAQYRIRSYRYSENDVTLQLLSHCFDGFGSNFYSGLLSGGMLIMVPDSRKMDYEHIKDIISRMGVTNTSLVPGMYDAILTGSNPGDLQALRFVVLAGDRCVPALVERSKEKAPRALLINEYGPSEVSVTAAVHQGIHQSNTAVIGKPISKTSLYVLDGSLNPLPTGIAGELHISGPGVTRGYLNNPQLTQKKFIPLPAPFMSPQSPPSRLYKTGDRARWLAGGNIEFLGRTDRQVKIRGFRIELEEIEHRLLTHDAINQAAVIAREEKNQNKFLCAYYVEAPGGQSRVEPKQLREYLLEWMPDHMLPSHFISLDSMPLTTTGKVDVKALPLPKIKTDEKYEAPRDQIEKKLVEIWAEILGIDKQIIGLDSNFFELGGHSLKAISVISRVHKELNVKLPLARIFEIPTVRNSSRCIKEAQQDKYLSIPPAAPKPLYPLSAAQKRLYIWQQVNTAGTAYNIPVVLFMAEGPDKKRLEAAFKKLVRRHDVLRTSFRMVGDDPMFEVHDHVDFSLEYYIDAVSPVEEIIDGFVKPFDLSHAPLLRAGLIKTGGTETRCILLADLHHIIADAVSKDVLRNDFAALYNGEELPPLRLQYKDYSEWWNSAEQRLARKKQEEYWLNNFDGELPVLTLPIDFDRPGIQTFEGSTISGEIPPEDAALLKKTALDEGVTLYILLFAVYNILLSKISGKEDIVVGTVNAGRQHPDLEQVIGMFVNTLAVRNFPTQDKSFVQFLGEVKKQILNAFENQDYPFDELVEKLMPVKDTNRHPLFNAVFALNTVDEKENNPEIGRKIDGEAGNNLPQSNYNYENKTSKFELCLTFTEHGDRLYFHMGYNTTLFKKETVENITHYLTDIAATVAGDKNIPLKDIKILHELLLSKPGKGRVEFEF